MLAHSRSALIVCFAPRRAWLVRPLFAALGFRARRVAGDRLPKWRVSPAYGLGHFGRLGAAALLRASRALRCEVRTRTPSPARG